MTHVTVQISHIFHAYEPSALNKLGQKSHKY